MRQVCMAVLCCIFSTTVSAAPSGAAAQSPDSGTVIESTPSCPQCKMRLQKLASLGGGEEVFTKYSMLARDSRGRFYVTNTIPSATEAYVAIYDSSGHRIGKLGRMGRGPGEFSVQPSEVRVGRGDTVYVLQEGVPMLTVFDREGRYVRSASNLVTLSLMHDVILGPHDEMVGLWGLGRPDSAKPAFRMLGADMKFRSDFGPTIAPSPNPQLARSQSERDRIFEEHYSRREWNLASDGSERFWSLTFYPYELEQWGFAGNRLQKLVRHPSWQEPVSEAFAHNRPPVIMWGLGIMKNGDVLTLATATHGDLRSAAVEASKQHRELGVNEVDSLKETIFELIDPRSRRLVTSVRVPGFYRGIFCGDLVTRMREDADGNVWLDVYRIVIDRLKR